jgi:D-arginine dehydrogenase
MLVDNAEILIVGGGIAGLSTAFHLAAAGARDIVLVEREDLPGFYASGHNAGIARQLTGRPEHTALTRDGSRRLAQAGLLTPTGGYLLGADPKGAQPLAREAEALGIPVRLTEGCPFPGFHAAETLHIPSDGGIDGDGLLRHCAEGARTRGAVLRFGCQVREVTYDGRTFLARTDQGDLRARYLVNAAGAWAGEIGRQAGGLDLAFTPLRRHLVWSPAPYPKDRPYVWWADRPFYVRPESGGLLLCACDEGRIPLPSRGLQPPTDEGILEGLAGSLRELAPGLREVPIARLWCGLRTFAPDRRFVLGMDPFNANLLWVAGLGGHGMTSGLAVGALAARVLLEGEGAGLLNPGRFLQH